MSKLRHILAVKYFPSFEVVKWANSATTNSYHPTMGKNHMPCTPSEAFFRTSKKSLRWIRCRIFWMSIVPSVRPSVCFASPTCSAKKLFAFTGTLLLLLLLSLWLWLSLWLYDEMFCFSDVNFHLVLLLDACNWRTNSFPRVLVAYWRFLNYSLGKRKRKLF